MHGMNIKKMLKFMDFSVKLLTVMTIIYYGIF